MSSLAFTMLSTFPLRHEVYKKTRTIPWKEENIDETMHVLWANERLIIYVYKNENFLKMYKDGSLANDLNTSVLQKNIVVVEGQTADTKAYNIIAAVSFNTFVIGTGDKRETILTLSQLVLHVYSSFHQNIDFHLTTGTRDVFTNYVTHKKRKMTVCACYITQLAVIPSVSMKKAKGVSKRYKNMRSLLLAFDKHSDDHIVRSIRRRGVRGIGKKTISTIRFFFAK